MKYMLAKLALDTGATEERESKVESLDVKPQPRKLRRWLANMQEAEGGMDDMG